MFGLSTKPKQGNEVVIIFTQKRRTEDVGSKRYK